MKTEAGLIPMEGYLEKGNSEVLIENPELFQDYLASLEEKLELASLHAEDLKEKIERIYSFSRNTDSRIPEMHFAHLQLCHNQLFQVVAKIESLRSQGELFHTLQEQGLFGPKPKFLIVEKEIDEQLYKLKTLRTIIAAIYEASGYQSVSTDYSIQDEQGFGQSVDSDVSSYYARSDLAPQKMEKYYSELILTESEREEAFVNRTTLLFNSGMGAISTCLLASIDGRDNPRVLRQSVMYFENPKALTDVLQGRGSVKEFESMEDLRNRPDLLDADVIFLEPNPNQMEAKSIDVISILRTPSSKPRIVIVDYTSLGLNFDFKEAAKVLDNNTELVLVSSLQKMMQLGDDAVSAGVCTIISSDYREMNQLKAKIFTKRAHLGTNISESSVHKLPRLEREQYRKYNEKIFRNTKLYEEGIASSPIIEKVFTTPDSTSPVLYLSLSRPVADKVVNKVIRGCYQNQVQASNGSSFGYRSTRFNHQFGTSGYEKNKIIRIAPGIESELRTKEIIQIFNHVVMELENAPEEK